MMILVNDLIAIKYLSFLLHILLLNIIMSCIIGAKIELKDIRDQIRIYLLISIGIVMTLCNWPFDWFYSKHPFSLFGKKIHIVSIRNMISELQL